MATAPTQTTETQLPRLAAGYILEFMTANTIANVGLILIALTSIAAAVWLMLNNHPGVQWGWFVVTAIVATCSVTFFEVKSK